MEKINEKTLLSLGLNATVLPSCDSTNEYALHNGGVVFALSQTCGRGRNGRSFFSGEGGIYTSVAFERKNGFVDVLNKKIPFAPATFTVAAGCAVCKLLAEYRFDASIKWVNDVFVGGKKVCGILAEGNDDYAVIGIGINYCSQIPTQLINIAASLFGSSDGINVFAAKLYESLYRELQNVDYNYYKSHCFTLGKTVSTNYGIGVAEDIEQGYLIVNTEKGRIKVCAGEAIIINN